MTLMAIDRAYLNLCTKSLQSADQAINRSVKLMAPCGFRAMAISIPN